MSIGGGANAHARLEGFCRQAKRRTPVDLWPALPFIYHAYHLGGCQMHRLDSGKIPPHGDKCKRVFERQSVFPGAF